MRSSHLPSLRLPTRLQRQIDEHAVASYPQECCGALLGAAGKVRAIWPARNADQGNREQRFEIESHELIEIYRYARSTGLDIVGYYHSHPKVAARPSGRDRENAWPGLSYLIVQVRDRRVEDRRSWRLDGHEGRFLPQRLVEGEDDELATE